MGRSPRRKPLGFSAPAEELGSARPGARCIVLGFRERGSQLVKGNFSPRKGSHGEKLESVGCRRLRERGKGEPSRVISLSSPNSTKLLTMTRVIYRIHGEFRGLNSQDNVTFPLRLSSSDAVARLLRWG